MVNDRGVRVFWRVETKEKLKSQLLPTFLLDGYFGCASNWKVQRDFGNLESRPLR